MTATYIRPVRLSPGELPVAILSSGVAGAESSKPRCSATASGSVAGAETLKPRLHRPGLQSLSPGHTSKSCYASQGFRQTNGWHLPLSEHPPEPPPQRYRWIYGLAFLLLGGYLLFAHGCHGDEDNELFTALRSFAKQSPAKKTNLNLPPCTPRTGRAQQDPVGPTAD